MRLLRPPCRSPERGGRAPARGARDPRADSLRRQRPSTPGSRHQLKAVRVNEGGRGAWHRSISAHKGGFRKSTEESEPRDPGRRPSLRGSYLGSALGAVASPEAPRALTRREAAGRKPPTRTAPSQSSAVGARPRRSGLPGRAQRRPRARRDRLARRRCRGSLELHARSPARPLNRPRAAHAQFPRRERARERAPRGPEPGSALRVLAAAEPPSNW